MPDAMSERRGSKRPYLDNLGESDLIKRSAMSRLVTLLHTKRGDERERTCNSASLGRGGYRR
jgi:hypothetical protein